MVVQRRQEPTKRAKRACSSASSPRDEGHPQQLPVRVLERRPRLAARVDDGLGVAEVRLGGVLLDAVAERRHDQLDLLPAELAQGEVVLGREDQDLVDAAGRGLGEDGAAVGHHEGLVTLEGGVEVGDDPHEPAARRTVGLERRRGLLLVARAKGAGAVQGVGHEGAGHEGVGPLGTPGADHHPTTGQRIKSELVHRCAFSGGSATLPRKFHHSLHLPRYRVRRPK